MTGFFSDLARTTTGIRATSSLLRDGLAALTPRRLTAALARDPRDVVVALDADGQAHLAAPKAGQATGEDLTTALRRARGAGAALTITVPPARAFVRGLTVPSAALTRLAEVLALDLERATPFKRDAVFAAHRVLTTTGESAAIEHVLVKASLVRPLLDAARAANMPVKAIRLANGPHADLNLLPAAQRQRSGITRAMAGLTTALVVASALFAAGAYGLQTWRLREAVAQADSEQQQLTASVAALRREAQDADRAVQDARFARARRIDQPLVVAVLEDLSRRLPNTTWLSDLRLDDTVISLDGHSANAAELVTILSRSPYVASAAFAAPITRDAQRGSERFQIRMTRAPTQKVSP